MNRKYDTTEANTIYGRRLNRTMNAAGISANRLNTHSWISKSMINKLRRGEHSPTLDMILTLNEALQEMGAEPVQISIRDIPRPALNPEPEPKVKAPKVKALKAKPEPMPEPEPEPLPVPEQLCHACGERTVDMQAHLAIHCTGKVKEPEPMSMMERMRANLK